MLSCVKTAQHCRLGVLQDSDFAGDLEDSTSTSGGGDLEDSKSTSGGVLFIFGFRTLVPISSMCKKQTSVSHSSTESEIISLDAGLRMCGQNTLTARFSRTYGHFHPCAHITLWLKVSHDVSA